MSDKRDDGGPAFPTETEHQSGSDRMHLEGMSLRDWFAGQEPGFDKDTIAEWAASLADIPVCVASVQDKDAWVEWWIKAEAKYKYRKADAMLKARQA
jgi:hypothetical protein